MGLQLTVIVVAVAKGLALAMDRTRLAEYGGPATLTIPWAKSLLKRMNFTKRRVTTKCNLSSEDLEEVRRSFLTEILETVSLEDIPAELIFNWDQTGINLVPTALWTMDKKGNKRVPIQGHQDKRQITAVMCGSLVGELLPLQLIYGGKTRRCHPAYQFPGNWVITHTENHWSNESTMLEYIKEIIVPFVDHKRESLELSKDHPALALFDHFKGQLTEAVTKELEDNFIHSVLIPATYTGQLQPLDISVNKVMKSFLWSKLSEWYTDELTELFINEDDTPVDLSTARMKCIGGQWIVRAFEHLENNPHIIVHGFRHAGIFDALGIIDQDELPDYESEDDSDFDEDEDMVTEMTCRTSGSLKVSDVYSESEEDDIPVITITSSEEE